jgi:hypothetical protein
MWWVWAIVGLAVLLAILFVLMRGKPGPDSDALRDNRRDHRPGGDPSDTGPIY